MAAVPKTIPACMHAAVFRPMAEAGHSRVTWGSSAEKNGKIVMYGDDVIKAFDGNNTYLVEVDSSKTLVVGAETATLELPANVTATYNFKGVTGSANADAATEVPVDAEVTVTVGNVAYYVEMDGAYKSNAAFDPFTMSADKKVSTDKYHQVSFGTVNAGSVSTELGTVEINGAIADAPVFVKQGDSVKVTFTVGGTGNTTATVYAQMDTVTGLTSTEFASKAEIIGASTNELTVTSDSVEIGTSTNTKDVTIGYTLYNSL